MYKWGHERSNALCSIDPRFLIRNSCLGTQVSHANLHRDELSASIYHCNRQRLVSPRYSGCICGAVNVNWDVSRIGFWSTEVVAFKCKLDRCVLDGIYKISSTFTVQCNFLVWILHTRLHTATVNAWWIRGTITLSAPPPPHTQKLRGLGRGWVKLQPSASLRGGDNLG